MISFLLSISAWFIATFIPSFLGIEVILLVSRKVDSRIISSFALGIFLWFFVDTMEGSAALDVNSGFSGGISQLLVVAMFAFGLLLFFYLGSSLGRSAQGSIIIPLLVSIAVGIHGIGEGAAFGGTVSQTSSTDLIEAFGGISAAVAYILHKFLEPFMIAACYLAYESARNFSKSLKDSFILALLFSLNSVIGAATGYFLNYDSTYFFALGVGTSIYPASLLARSSLTGSLAPKEALKISIAITLGLLAIYFAALFHS